VRLYLSTHLVPQMNSKQHNMNTYKSITHVCWDDKDVSVSARIIWSLTDTILYIFCSMEWLRKFPKFAMQNLLEKLFYPLPFPALYKRHSRAHQLLKSQCREILQWLKFWFKPIKTYICLFKWCVRRCVFVPMWRRLFASWLKTITVMTEQIITDTSNIVNINKL
jgi:hypothetical protein